ncbi:MAG: hypothetical protein HOQ24_10280 [Mycobacteriaceae bacterium]|nr:hypothetical protein [Mycobacteriaceae bacterium]
MAAVIASRDPLRSDPAYGAAVGEEVRLRPTGALVLEARAFVARTVARWERVGVWGGDLGSAGELVDVELLDVLMSAAVWSNRGRFRSRMFARLASSRRVETVGSRYWLRVGRLWLEVRPRWATAGPGVTVVDERRPVTVRMRTFEQGGELVLRIEVTDARLLSDADSPEVLDQEMARLARLCGSCARYSPQGTGGWTTWITVRLRDIHSPDSADAEGARPVDEGGELG